MSASRPPTRFLPLTSKYSFSQVFRSKLRLTTISPGLDGFKIPAVCSSSIQRRSMMRSSWQPETRVRISLNRRCGRCLKSGRAVVVVGALSDYNSELRADAESMIKSVRFLAYLEALRFARQRPGNGIGGLWESYERLNGRLT